MKDNPYLIALAGLLHDIGKVEQRARLDPWKPAPGFESEGQPVHATWSGYFVQNYVPQPYRAAALAGTYHHAPHKSPAADQRLSTLIALADKLSAGERADQPKDYPHKNPPQQMISIFDQISLHGEPRQEDFHYLPLAKLALKYESLFPDDAISKGTQTDAYEELRNELAVAARHDPGDDQTYLENMLGAMQRATWCIPSAYYHSLPDVSLYDHSRMTAALAVCLSEKTGEEIQNLLDAVKRDFYGNASESDVETLSSPAALLVGGDISGIQKFIYTLSSKGAARTLRGRSFYLQLLTEALLRYILRKLSLPTTNVIYSGGGHFSLLAPISAAPELPEIQRFITRTLLAHHKAGLYLALGHSEIPASGFRIGNFPRYWTEMFRQIVIAKQHRYTELGDDMYQGVFEPLPHGGDRKNTCSVCGEERQNTSPLDDGETDDRICSLCTSFDEEIGRLLPHKDFIGLGFGDPQRGTAESALDVLRSFGMEVRWSNAGDAITFNEDTDRTVIWALGDEEEWPQVDVVPAAKATKYTVNLIPEVKDRSEAESINKRLTDSDRKEAPARVGAPKTFTHLQVQADGIKRLGVLRMDVDNLGEIFKSGFGTGTESRATLARVSTLSFLMSIFFEGWIKKLCEEHGQQVYAVYAGGDDVFLIGPWHIMPRLAMQIARDLKRYAGDNPDIHISGGLAFIHGKYPVYQAADDAEEALDAAKDLDGKNAFGFLGQVWEWDEFYKISDRFDQIVKITTPEKEGGLGGPKELIQILRQLTEQKAQARRDTKGKLIYGPWVWQGFYRLKRLEERQSKKPELAQELAAIRNNLDEKKFGNVAQWGTAARWAQLYLRESSND